MKKVICDFCCSESENIKEYIIPSREPIEARGGMSNTLIFRCGYRVVDSKKDICPECQKKIAALLKLVPNMQIRDNNLASVKITIGG